jgi:hypothetical protein
LFRPSPSLSFKRRGEAAPIDLDVDRGEGEALFCTQVLDSAREQCYKHFRYIYLGAEMNHNLRLQSRLLFGSILANFVAQVIYFLHLYYTPEHPLPDLKSFLLMGSVFALFLIGYSLFVRNNRAGFFVLALFLALEFFFYLWNIIGGVLNGFGLFFHLGDRDPILWLVFAIGYLNFFTAGYWLFLLLNNRTKFTRLD